MLSHTYVLSSEICISPCPHVSFLHSLSLSQIKLRRPITKHCPLLPVCFGKPSQRLCSTVHCAGWTPALGGTFVILPVLPIQNQFGHNTSLHLALPYLSGQSSCFSRWFPSQRNAHVYQFPSTGCYYKTQTPELTTPVISSLFIVKLYVFFLSSIKSVCTWLTCSVKGHSIQVETLFLNELNKAKAELGVSSWVTPTLDEHTWEEVRFMIGARGREVSHPLRDRSGLTNAWVEGGVV